MEKENSKIKDWSKTYIFKNIVNGFMIVLPIIIVVALLIFLIRLVTKLIAPFTQFVDPNNTAMIGLVHVFLLLVFLVIFFVIGLLISTSQGKALFATIEQRLLMQIPLYSTVQNIVSSFRGVGEQPFNRVVLVDVYGTGALMTGFVVERINEEMIVIYVPTAPNPTNGFVFHIKEKDVIDTKAKSEDAMGTVIAVGAGSKKLFENVINNNVEFENIADSNPPESENA